MIDSNNKLKTLSKSLIESVRQVVSEKKADKDLAKLAPPKDKVTHADVLVGRGVYTHDEVKAHKAKKGIKEDADAVIVFAPVLDEIHGEIAEVLKRDPRDKSVTVTLEGVRYTLKHDQYRELPEAVKNPYAVGMAAAMKSTGDTPPLKKSTITKAHEIAKKVAEEVEQIDELSRKTMASYIKGAAKDIEYNAAKRQKFQPWQNDKDPDIRAAGRRRVDNADKALDKRMKGTSMAATKLAKEEAEQIDEISKKTLGSYVKKATNQVFSKGVAGGAGLAGNKEDEAAGMKNVNKAAKRMQGVNLAASKLSGHGYTKVQAKEDVELTQEEIDFIEATMADLEEGIESETIKYPVGQRPKGIGWTLKQAGEQTGKDHSIWQRKVKKVAEEVDLEEGIESETIKYPVGQRPKGIGWTLKQAGEQTGKDHSIWQRKVKKVAEEVDLEEGRGRPPKEGSAAWHAKQKQAVDDMPALGVQIRKAASINKPVTFANGESKSITQGHINKFHDHMDARKSTQDKAAFQKRAHKSHEEFVKAVSEPVPGHSKDTGEIVKYK